MKTALCLAAALSFATLGAVATPAMAQGGSTMDTGSNASGGKMSGGKMSGGKMQSKKMKKKKM